MSFSTKFFKKVVRRSILPLEKCPYFQSASAQKISGGHFEAQNVPLPASFSQISRSSVKFYLTDQMAKVNDL